MGLHNFQPSEGSSTRRRRIGRGIGSGMGKTCTRGTKGQSARKNIHPGFEGGQSPIQKRLPKKKGFRNINHKDFAIVNLDDLEKFFEAGAEVTPETLIKAGVISGIKDGVKVLAFGTLSKKLTVSAHKFSAAATESITGNGGETVTL
ncbi:MAG: 50S ribosomal protein L15 [Fimbriimonas sp.]